MPERIQRKRVKGWRIPEGVVYVGRPSVWGNPFRPHTDYDEEGKFKYDKEICLDMFQDYCAGRLMDEPEWLTPLRGKDLACWCKAGAPCHADILLKLANA